MTAAPQKGWFKVPGIRPDGDRTIAEQVLGLKPALDEARGKSVLDLGCAEGCISAEFAKAGAARVVAIELLAPHLEVARRYCKGLAQIEFVQAHLDEWAEAHPEPERFDIVLALGIIHKLHDPHVPLRFAARSCRSLLCFRAPAMATDGIIKSKHTARPCNVPKVLTFEGFTEEQLIPGVRGEAVQYWRRGRG